jgi:transcriptional antiterminator RfaH
MPLLPLEPYLWPEDLLARRPGISAPQGSDERGGGARWWALHTKPRTEKSLARYFLHRKLAFFLPLAKKQWRTKGRPRTSYVPLFSGYIFFHGDNQARLEALGTHQVVKCLAVENQGQLHEDLARIHQLMISGAPIAAETRLRPGAWVEITAGPLQGLQGKVLRRGKRWRFVVEVHFLQRGASVEIDGDMIQPALEQQS